MKEIKNILICGAGMMGKNIGYVFASNPSFQVGMYDLYPTDVEAGIRTNTRQLLDKGVITEQELSDRWVVEQMSELTAMTASFVLATPTETDGALFPGRIMLANTCMWTYRSDECGYTGGAVADEFDKPTTDIRKDRCSKCMRGCEMRGMVANFGGFLSINKLSQ